MSKQLQNRGFDSLQFFLLDRHINNKQVVNESAIAFNLPGQQEGTMTEGQLFGHLFLVLKVALREFVDAFANAACVVLLADVDGIVGIHKG